MYSISCKFIVFFIFVQLFFNNLYAQDIVPSQPEPLCPNQTIQFILVYGNCSNNLASSQKWTVEGGTLVNTSLVIVSAFIKSNNNGGKLTLKVEWTCATTGEPLSKTSTFRVRSVYGETPTIATNSVHGINPKLNYCENASITLNRMLIPAASNTQTSVYADSYRWVLPAGFSINGQTGVVQTSQLDVVIATNGCNTGIVKVFGVAECSVLTSYTSNELSINVQRQPNTVNITAPSVVKCEDIFSASIPTFACATNYTWTTPPNWIIDSGQGTSVITVTPQGNLTSGTIQVSVTLPCGTTLNGSITLEKNNAVATPIFENNNPIVLCQGGGNALVKVNVATGNPIEYVWTLTGSISFLGGGQTLTIPYPSGSNSSDVNIVANTPQGEGVVNVYAKNICGSLSQVASKNIWVGKPSIPVVNLFVIPDRASGSTSDLYVCPNKEYTIKFFFGHPMALEQGITHYSWQFTCGTHLYTASDTRSIRVKTAMAYNPCEEVWVRAHSICGISDWHKVNVDFANDCGGRLSTNSVRLFSNPSNAHTFVEIDNLPQVNYNQDTENTSAGFAYQIKVYDQVGTLRKEFNTNKVRKKIITSDLPVGQYRVIVSDEFETVEKILLVNR